MGRRTRGNSSSRRCRRRGRRVRSSARRMRARSNRRGRCSRRARTRCSRSRRADIPSIGTVPCQVFSRTTPKTLVFKRTIFGLVTGLLAGTARLWLTTITNFKGEVQDTDDFRNLRCQFDAHNPDARLNVLKSRMDLARTLQNLTKCGQRMTDRIS